MKFGGSWYWLKVFESQKKILKWQSKSHGLNHSLCTAAHCHRVPLCGCLVSDFTARGSDTHSYSGLCSIETPSFQGFLSKLPFQVIVLNRSLSNLRVRRI